MKPSYFFKTPLHIHPKVRPAHLPRGVLLELSINPYRNELCVSYQGHPNAMAYIDCAMRQLLGQAYAINGDYGTFADVVQCHTENGQLPLPLGKVGGEAA